MAISSYFIIFYLLKVDSTYETWMIFDGKLLVHRRRSPIFHAFEVWGSRLGPGLERGPLDGDFRDRDH